MTDETKKSTDEQCEESYGSSTAPRNTTDAEEVIAKELPR